MARLASVLVGLICFGWVSGSATAQDRPGRFTMTPADGGFMRLDTETGALAHCIKRAEQWTCEPANDIARDEAAKLKAENKELKGEIRRMEDIIVGEPKAGTPPGTTSPRPQVQLPSEQDFDRAINELERLFKKYRDRLKEFDRSIATPSPAPSQPAPAPLPPMAPSEPKSL